MPHFDGQPEWDAQTLAEAKVIASDSSRLAKAKKASIKLAKERREAAAAMAAVSSKKVVKKQSSVSIRKEMENLKF